MMIWRRNWRSSRPARPRCGPYHWDDAYGKNRQFRYFVGTTVCGTSLKAARPKPCAGLAEER